MIGLYRIYNSSVVFTASFSNIAEQGIDEKTDTILHGQWHKKLGNFQTKIWKIAQKLQKFNILKKQS